MTDPRWISKKALRLLHEESLARFGGDRGLRDEGLLDSALARPQNHYAYNAGASIPALAAACAFGLAKNHPFVVGNKRASFLSIGIMLSINGLVPTAKQSEAIEAIVSVASGAMDENALGDWIGKNCVEKKRPGAHYELPAESPSKFARRTNPQEKITPPAKAPTKNDKNNS